MEKLIVLTMGLVVIASIYLTGKALHDLNDGRVQTVVKQLVK